MCEPKSKFSRAMYFLSFVRKWMPEGDQGNFQETWCLPNWMSSTHQVYLLPKQDQRQKTCWHPVIWNHSLLLWEREGGDGWAMSYGWTRTHYQELHLRWKPEGRRRRGRPKVTWWKTMVRELKECGLSLETARRWVEDWQQWRTLTEVPCATLGTLDPKWVSVR